MIKIGINGFGRIGRLAFKYLLANKNIDIVAINDLADAPTLAYLLSYDSVHGQAPFSVSSTNNELIVDKKAIVVLKENDPLHLPWAKHGISMVLEATGRFTDKEGASKHLQAGARQVVISAPAKGEGIPSIVLGVNEGILNGTESIVSNASCTTNCLAPMVKVLDEHFGIEKGTITTVHAYTADQRLQDAPHKDLRRARAAALSIIPTSTGAARAVGAVLPSMEGKLHGLAMRVPVPSGSLTDFTVCLNRATSIKGVCKAMREASEGALRGILQYSEAPIVSADIIGNTHSCIFDAPLTAVDDKLAKVIGWYDNEAGYAKRIADLIEYMRKKG